MRGIVTDDIGAGEIARQEIDLGKITKTYQEAGSKVCGAKDPPPGKQGKQHIQVPFSNTFGSIWEYRESFLAGRIDFASFIGPLCPICGEKHCYREIGSYWRYAIDLFPEYKKERVPVARFICRRSGKTFSLLPIQLIPYFQYTVQAIVGVLLLALKSWESGQRGFHGAAVRVDPDSGVTPWLVSYWVTVILSGFRQAHATLMRWYDLSCIRSLGNTGEMEEAAGYVACLGWRAERVSWALMQTPATRYSGQTKRFLFGTPSQRRSQTGSFSRRFIPA